MSVYRFPRRALTLCLQLRMGIRPGARFPARSADALSVTLYGHFTQAIYRNRSIDNKHSTDVESMKRVLSSVRMMSVYPEGKSRGHVRSRSECLISTAPEPQTLNLKP
jgi:hypothetical protein